MLSVPRLWGVLTLLFSLLGPSPDVARAEEVDPALLDACPGYNATSVNVDGPTLTAKLVLAGAPCNVFGNDIKVLDLTVVYETGTSAPQWASMTLKPHPPRCTRTPPRNTHSSQDNRRVQRALRSPRVRLSAPRG
jgi:hypothetical protein